MAQIQPDELVMPKRKDPLPPPFDHTGLPVGLPDFVYATWLAARNDLHHSPNVEVGERRFQFSCGYLQALQDTQLVDERLCRFLSEELLKMWVEAREALTRRGLILAGM